MKTISKISSILMLFTFAFASDAKTAMSESAENIKNVAPVKQLIKSELVSTNEVVPFNIDQMKKSRIEKSIRHKKYTDAVLKNLKSSEKAQKNITEDFVHESRKKDVLKRWSTDINSKATVINVKKLNGESAFKLPSASKTN